MVMTNYLGASLLALAATVLLIPATAAAQDRDTQEIQKYVLTDAGLAKYSQATREVAKLPGDQTGACEDHGDSQQTLSQAAARFDRYPAAKSAIQATGMTPREYVVFSLALFQTGLAVWGADQTGGKLPAGVSEANVAFYRKNELNLKKLETLTAYDDCDELADEEEEDIDE